MKFLNTVFFLLLFGFLLKAAELDIVCTTDLHGHFERIPALASVIRAAGSHALKIDVGDTLTGTFYSDLKKGSPMIKLLNDLEFDVWVPGNHDFELGPAVLSQNINAFKGSVLGAQWHWNRIRPLKWKLFERRGVRAAVIGLTDPAMPARVLPGDGGVFKDGHKTLKKIMPQVLAAQPDVIILAYHNGEYSRYGSTYALSRSFPEIDIILGGHSHKEVPGKQLGNAWFVQAGACGANAAMLKVIIDDKTRRIKKITSGLFATVPGKRDEKLTKYCWELLAKQRQASNVPLVSTGKRIIVSRYAAGRFLAEQMQKMTGGGAAMIQRPEVKFSGKRRKRYKNTVVGVGTVGDVYRLFPYNNRICLVTFFRRELPELEQYLRRNSSRRKVRYFFSGDISRDKRGRLFMKKESTSLAVTDYLLVSIPVLRRKLENKNLWRLIPHLTERQAAEEMFRVLISEKAMPAANRQKPVYK